MGDAKRFLKNGNQWRGRIIVCGSCRRHPRLGCPVHPVDLDRLFIVDEPPRKSFTINPHDLPVYTLGGESQILPTVAWSAAQTSFSQLFSIFTSSSPMVVRQ